MAHAQNPIEKHIQEIEARIRAQKDLLQRKIAQGTIAQSDDDLLRQMYRALKEMQAARLAGRQAGRA